MAHAVTEVKRREVIKVLGGVAAYPLLGSRAAHAQQAMPVIGFLRSTPSAPFPHLVAAFRQGLKESGFVEGQNVTIEQRWIEGANDRLPVLAADLIRLKAAVIVGNNLAALAAKAVTTTIPVVFATGSDPVQDGLVTSLNRPGGNVTGIVFLTGILGGKRLELLRQIVPTATTIAAFVNLVSTEAEDERRELENAAKAIGQQLIVFDFSGGRDIEATFATFAQSGIGALLVGSGAFFNTSREKIVALAALHRIPAMHPLRESADAGGLMSYGTSQTDAYRQAGMYAGRILKGEKPGDLPVLQSTKFEFVINLKTAKTLGLEFHPQLLATADEVIE
jgi:putative ABC transport system substrate-binding protein